MYDVIRVDGTVYGTEEGSVFVLAWSIKVFRAYKFLIDNSICFVSFSEFFGSFDIISTCKYLSN